MKLNDIIALDKQYYMNTFGDRTPIAFERGDGTTLYDIDGNAYTDLFAGIAVTSLGYNHPKVTAALIAQAQKLWHTSNLYYVPVQSRLAKLLIDNSCADRVFFSNSGAEANEGAMKLALKHFYKKGIDRHEIITVANSFHGRTIATVKATGQPKYQAPYAPILPTGIINVAFGDLAALKAAIGPHTAAIMLEVIQGEGGVFPAGEEYLKAIRKLCDENGCLLIFDEIQVGLCRTGKLFSFEHYGIEPDIFTLAKALGNGVPIGAFLAKGEVADAFDPGDHGSTYAGGPLVCAAAEATIEVMLFDNIARQAADTGAWLKAQLQAVQAQFPSIIQEVRGMGLLIGLGLSSDVPAASLLTPLRQKGYIVGTAAANTLRLAPPLIIEKSALEGFIEALKEVLGTLT